MSAVVVRNLSEETHRALKRRASENGRSTEAEIRLILDMAVRPECRMKIGAAIGSLSRKSGLLDADVDALEATFVRPLAEPVSFD